VALHKHERDARRDGARAQEHPPVRRVDLLLRQALQRRQARLEQAGAADEAHDHHGEWAGWDEAGE
jgi:hypothetical protein